MFTTRTHRMVFPALLAGGLVFVVGCASTQERQALSAFETTKTKEIRGIVPAQADAHQPTKLPETPTLQNYLVYAALNNPDLEAAFNQWKAALKRIPQARSLPDPRFTFGYFIEEVETRVGPQEHRLGLSQMFPWFGKLRLRGEAALEEANAAQQNYEAIKLKLFYRMRDAFYEYYYLGRAIAITEDNVRLMQHLESVARAKHRAGAPLSGVIKAQVELGKLDDQLRALRDLQGPVVARLNAVLNRPTETAAPWPGNIPGMGRMSMSDQDALRWLLEGNPELRALDYQIKKSEKGVGLARKEYYPDITVGVDYIDTGGALVSGAPDSGKDPVIGMVAINLPIWRGKLRAGVEEAEAKRDAAEEIRTARENALQAELKMVLYRCRDAQRKINLYGGSLVPQALQSLNVTQQAYEAGKADFLDLVDAQRLLLQFQLEYERAWANHHQRMAELEMLIGRPIETEPMDPPSGAPAPGLKESHP